MSHFKNYTANKNEILAKIDAAKAKITELSAWGINVRDSVQKMDNAKAILMGDKVSVVLVGAFSDGKTSVIAGWLNEKMDNMKIDSDESSDEILCYTPASIPEGCQIVDTPGLFGNKEGSDENGGTIQLSEKTRKFISEANLILYVVTAKNPVKDSHKESIRWILKDLNKLSSTIFVINRMDDVADMTDEDDYALHARIKTENLRSKLTDCGLSPEEAEKVKVVCISAAPDGRSVEQWEGYREIYLQRSRLDILEKTTNEILQNSRQQLITKTGCDILQDEIRKKMQEVHTAAEKIDRKALPLQRDTLQNHKKDLARLYKRVIENRGAIRDDLRALQKRKRAGIRAATIENYHAFLEDEIGLKPENPGHLLAEEINAVFERYCQMNASWAHRLSETIQTDYQRQDSFMEELFTRGAGTASKTMQSAKFLGTGVIKDGIFAGRDLLGKVGMNIKFKPWQVTKMAGFATKALPVAGAALDIVMDIKRIGKERKLMRAFENAKDAMKKEVEKLFEDVIEKLKDDKTYIQDFAPDYSKLEQQIKENETAIQKLENTLASFAAWEKSTAAMDFTIR